MEREPMAEENTEEQAEIPTPDVDLNLENQEATARMEASAEIGVTQPSITPEQTPIEQPEVPTEPYKWEGRRGARVMNELYPKPVNPQISEEFEAAQGAFEEPEEEASAEQPEEQPQVVVAPPSQRRGGLLGMFGRARSESSTTPGQQADISAQIESSPTQGFTESVQLQGEIQRIPENIERESGDIRSNVLIIMDEHAKPARDRDRRRLDRAYENLRQLWFKETEWSDVNEVDRGIKITKKAIKDVEKWIPEGQTKSYEDQIREIRRMFEVKNAVLFRSGIEPKLDKETSGEIQEVIKALSVKQAPYIEQFHEYVEQKAQLLGMQGVNATDILEQERMGLVGVLLDSNRIFKSTKELWNDDYGLIRFTADDRKDVEDALKDFIEFTEARKGFFDPEKGLGNVKRIMDIVTRSAERMGMDEEKAQMTGDNVVARIVIFLHNEFAKVGNMGACASLKEIFWKDRGKQRTKALFGETEVSGYDPEHLAIALVSIGYDGRFIPYYRPYGPNGQFVTHAYAQGNLRDEVEQVLYEDIMRYELKGTERRPGESDELFRARNDIARRLNRDKVIWQQPIESFKNLFTIGDPVRRPGETDEQFNARVERDNSLKVKRDKAKKAGKLALQLNAFFGHQAEMRGVSIVTENGDYVHRRHAEKFVKFAIIEEMRRRHLSPLTIERELINSAPGERTPRLTERPEFKDAIKQALDTIWKRGNSASWVNSEGKTVYLEDIIANEEVRLIYDGFVANDFPLRSLITSEETRMKAQQRNNDGSFVHNDFITRTRRIIDPFLQMRPMPHNEEGRRAAAEAIDFTLRTQAESSMAIFERFLNNIDQGSQGAGLLTETRIYDLRGTLSANKIENIKYAEGLIAYLPEIYSFPLAMGGESTWDVVQEITMTNPKMDTTDPDSKYPETFENYTGEIQAAIYKIMVAIRSLVRDDPEPDKGTREKSLFHEVVSSREQLIPYNTENVGRTIEHANALVEYFRKTFLVKPQAVFTEYEMLLDDTRMLEIIKPSSWALGILYDQLVDWLVSPETGKNSREAGAGGGAYDPIIGQRLSLLENENKQTHDPLRKLLKLKMVPLPVKPLDK